MSAPLTFRRLTDDDLPLLHRWLNEPGIVQWWEGDDVSWQAVVTEYGSANDEPVEHYLAVAGGEPFGWIETYAVADFADHDEPRAWFELGYPMTGAGIDYLIGEPGRRGRGLGSAMIRAFVERIIWPGHPDWTHVGASPVRANVASCRALSNAGLSLLGSFDDADHGICDLYAAPRPT